MKLIRKICHISEYDSNSLIENFDRLNHLNLTKYYDMLYHEHRIFLWIVVYQDYGRYCIYSAWNTEIFTMYLEDIVFFNLLIYLLNYSYP